MKIERIAVLSNVNVNPIAHMLDDYAVYEAEGYGNELETLMNQSSALYGFKPKAIVLLIDLMEAFRRQLDVESAKKETVCWFRAFEACISPDCIYMVSDGYLYGEETAIDLVNEKKSELERVWKERLKECASDHANVYAFPLHQVIEGLGEEAAFSKITWYMGKIPFSLAAQKRIAQEIKRQIEKHSYTPKKALVTDLDNTLWGGLAGENDKNPIQLSEDGKGLAYKNTQRVMKIIKDSGAVLCIASKNNERDAMEIIENHPHMALRAEDFVIKKINWNPKPDNILEIAKELNLGLDSIVFLDDSPWERELVKNTLPEVLVPDFPKDVARLPGELVKIYQKYFEKPVLTKEDMQKSKQYASNVRREHFQSQTASFPEYLKGLQIVVETVDPASSIKRLVQLANKTNQFNLTTKRYTLPGMQEILSDENIQVYAYQVSDRFGDLGIVAIVEVDFHSKIPTVTEFAMSCRAMGRNIEYGIVDDIENAVKAQGYDKLRAQYIPTAKNKPVEGLWTKLGYRALENADGCFWYEIDLFKKQEREYYFAKDIGGMK